MKAAQINDYGGKDALFIQEAAKPRIDDAQLLIEVYAAGVNPFDWKVREGSARQMKELDMPATLGGDLSGVVVEVGSAVSEFKVGDEIYGQANALSGQGSFAEYAPVKAASVALKPQSADFVAAAALPLTAASAYQALVDHLNLQKGQKILIHGGAGGIGSQAIQIAKNLGAYVATTVKAEDNDYVKQLGADEIIDYTSQDFTDVVKDYDAVFDTVGGETFTRSYQVLKPGGILVSMLSTVQPNEALEEQYQVKTVKQSSHVTTDKLQAVAKMVDNGQLKAHVQKVYPLEAAPDALEDLKTGHARGKLVIKIKD